MRKLIIATMAILCATAYSSAMYMPEDTEILEGYHLEDPADHISPEDVYFEVRSLTGHAMMPIRNKRNVKYEVLQSTGLKSHFKNVPDVHETRRQSRSVENEATPTTDEAKSSAKTEENQSEALPTAEKQTMVPNRYAADQSASSSNVMDRWNSSPFEYTKLQRHNDEDPMTDAHAVNEGIKSRTPRVHFVTQPKKNTDSKDVSVMNMDLNAAAATKSDIYRDIPTERMEDRRYLPERNGESSNRYSNYDLNSRRYDRYERDLLYQPPYMRALDYMPRTPAPYPSMDYYYDYFDRRYDLPDYRDNRHLYSNDLNERYPISVDLKPPRNHRIIYYANLPEIIRAPPTVDLRYRTYGTRYDYPGYPPYNAYYRPVSSGTGTPAYSPKSGAMKTDDRKYSDAMTTDKRNDGSVRISSALTVKEAPGGGGSKGKILKRTHDYDRY